MSEDSKYGTSFIETEMLLAAQSDDWAEVDRILDGMSSNEVNALERVIDHLQDRLWAVMEADL